MQKRQTPALRASEEPDMYLHEGRAEMKHGHIGILILAAANYGSLDLAILTSFYWNMLCVITINTTLKRFLGQGEGMGLNVLIFSFSCKTSGKIWECYNTKIRGCLEPSALSKDEKQTGQKPFWTSALWCYRDQENKKKIQQLQQSQQQCRVVHSRRCLIALRFIFRQTSFLQLE